MEVAQYGIGTWDAEVWGNHRALVTTTESAGAYRAVIPWRRSDYHPEKKGVFVRDEDSGEEAACVYVRSLTADAGEIAFSVQPGQGRNRTFGIYYLRYEGTTRAPYPQITYRAQPEPGDRGLWERLRDTWDDLPWAHVQRIESCGAIHSFFPMEVAATSEEMGRLTAQHSDHAFLLFAEERTFPIKMTHTVPYRWIERGPFQAAGGTAPANAYLAFQIGVFAHRQDLSHLTVEVSELVPQTGGGEGAAGEGAAGEGGVEGEVIPAGAVTCFNLSGTDWDGKPLAPDVSVPEGRVQALWFGVDLAEDQQPGRYHGMVTVRDDAGNAERIPVEVVVAQGVAPHREDDQPHLHSRLRWLNSDLGREETPIDPYTPVQLADDGATFSLLGRTVRVGAHGLPDRITSFFTPEVTGVGEEPFEILGGAVTFDVCMAGGATRTDETTTGAAAAHHGQEDRRGGASTAGTDATGTGATGTGASAMNARVNDDGWGVVSTERRIGAVCISTTATVEPDGCVEYTCLVGADERCEVDDIALEVPFAAGAARLMLGLGRPGGRCPDTLDWRWDPPHANQDAVWIGTERGGLQVSLKDEHYRRPLNTNFYRLQPLRLPTSWGNDGAGGITLRRDGGAAIHGDENGVYRLRCYSGPRVIAAGETLTFSFRLLVTPFRPIDTERQWSTRFCHKYGDPAEIQAQGANVINVHHAQPVNPFINYPFLRPQELKEYADTIHNLGMKLRLYYTVRELTNHAPEVFAFRSLGEEIFSHGPGGGHSWLQEHFRDDYIAAWHVFSYGCVATATSGESRWHNYYVEGINWLARQMEIDGIYIDDLAFDRTTMKRVRRVLDRHRDGALIDLHSANQFNEKDGYANSMNLYMEHLPYLDRVWFGEYFKYDQGPQYWMTEVAGIPFGTMGEMLQDGGHPWRGMLYGMTGRYPHEGGDPRPVWSVWNRFGIEGSRMLGYWAPSCPVDTSHPDILATVYAQDQRWLIALGSWAPAAEEVTLTIQWEQLPFGPEEADLWAPPMEGLQAEAHYAATGPIPIPAAAGALLILTRKARGSTQA